ncbi:MAG: branched-chain amino acid ABC transporter permease [Thermoanaerobaculia bacterium]|nr:branched-chain amino acid ABC transporter permease [Thermoanaerobaculia bacterium]
MQRLRAREIPVMVSQLVVNALIAAAYYGLIALSFAYVCRIAGFFHVAHGGVFTLAAYVTMEFCEADIGLIPASICAVAIAGAVGSAMEAIVFRPLRRRNATPEMMLMASFGILIVLQNLYSIAWGDARRAVVARAAEPGLGFLGGRATELQLIAIGLSVLASAGLIVFSRFTFSGLLLRAVSDDLDLARIRGVSSEKAILAGFAIASGLMGLAGVLHGLDVGMVPGMGFRALLVAFAGALLGGLDRDERAFAGGVTIGVLEQVAARYLPGQWYESVIFGTLVLILVVRGQALLRRQVG